MGIVGVVGVALLAALFILILRETRPVMALLLRLAVTIMLFAAAAALFLPVVTRIKSLLELSGGTTYTGIALGALGIALVSEFGAAFCRDLGEQTVGDCLLFFGKLEILLLTLPLLDRLIEMAEELLTW